MSLGRARILKNPSPAPANSEAKPSDPYRGTRIPREVVDAKQDAEKIVARARSEAEAILGEARARVEAEVRTAANKAREEELARVTTAVIVARALEEEKLERELDRTIGIAVILAERLVGEAIQAEPTRVKALATEALRETRGARQMRIEAHRDDVPILRATLGELGNVTDVVASEELARGSLIVHTNLGRIDARLEPQLARLAETLREALRR